MQIERLVFFVQEIIRVWNKKKSKIAFASFDCPVSEICTAHHKRVNDETWHDSAMKHGHVPCLEESLQVAKRNEFDSWHVMPRLSSPNAVCIGTLLDCGTNSMNQRFGSSLRNACFRASYFLLMALVSQQQQCT